MGPMCRVKRIWPGTPSLLRGEKINARRIVHGFRFASPVATLRGPAGAEERFTRTGMRSMPYASPSMRSWLGWWFAAS